MKAFLTGASGFVGSHLLTALLGEGAQVRCLVRSSSSRRNLEGQAAEVVTGDLRDPRAVAAALEGCDTAFHCAADYRLFVRDPDEMYGSNVEGTRNVLQAAADAGVEKVVYTSSVR